MNCFNYFRFVNLYQGGGYYCLYFEGKNRISLLQKFFHESTLTAICLFLLPLKRKPTFAFAMNRSTSPSTHHPAAMLIANRQSSRVKLNSSGNLHRIRTFNLYINYKVCYILTNYLTWRPQRNHTEISFKIHS